LLFDEAEGSDSKADILADTAELALSMGALDWVHTTWDTCHKLRVRAIIARARAFSDEPWIAVCGDDDLGRS
jgi:hypothetical protein